ncbi:MAG: SLBB domain-containing protein, partial [Deltaproteobacteria bacterium]|nr:SLBB domain-containing protein [Deltaproteobacteria bacterium]
ERIIKGETQVVVDINDKTLTSAKGFILQDGDLVKVFPIVDKDINAVYLAGNVKRPGKYELKPGMRIKDLIKDSSELLPETYFEYALIKREHPPGRETSLVPFNLARVLLDNDAANNVELAARDYVYIFSRWFFQDKPLVTVEGEIRAGGNFDLALNMKIKDAILSAGDLTKDAFLPKGEIIRVNKKREYQTIYFNIAKAMAEHPEDNLPLQNEDRIIIHSIWEERWKEMVSIVGEVKTPSEFLLTESMKISDLVFKAKGLTRDSYQEEAELYRTDWRTKEVTLQRFSLKKALEGDPDHNIQLKDLDWVVVHSNREKIYKKIVSVDGDVTIPGTYQYAEGMTVRDLVFAAGNVLESAYLEEAEISSQVLESAGGTRIEHRSINLKQALQNDPRHNLLLKPYDRLYVKPTPDWRKENFVTLTGEITLPGRYIIKKGERLSSLLARAKGFTPEAYLPAAFFTRESVRKVQEKRIRDFIEEQEQEIIKETARVTAAALSKEEAEQRQKALTQRKELVSRLKAAPATGRIVIKLMPLEKLKGSEFDIELEEGDTLNIPMIPSTVMVMGRVYNSNAILYTKDKPLEFYLNKVGGPAENADEKRIYLVKADGTVLSRTQSSFWGFRWDAEFNRWSAGGFMGAKMDPGDSILVPEKYERIYWTREIRDWTQILFQIAVAAGVLAALY